MPHLTQFLIFELGRGCNLGPVHAACPNMSPERFSHLDSSRRLDDDTIVDTAVAMYRHHGFTGLVGWHYYNEPLLQADRMFRLMERISAYAPEARYVLWSNGTLLPEDCSRFREFHQIHVTDYSRDGCPPQHLDKLLQAAPHAQVHSWQLDQRLTAIATAHNAPCYRMFTEMIFDHHGNMHLCCYDWRGLGSPGNLYTSDLDDLVRKWQAVRDSITGRAMTRDAPAVCTTCAMRCGLARFVPEVAARAGEHLERQRIKAMRPRPAEKVAVVFVAYLKVPEQRLRDHFHWNDALYRQSRATVYVVTDREHDGLPDYAVQVLYPLEDLPVVDGKPRFSLTKTKNRGIEQAVEEGADFIVVTDVDMVYSAECWQWMLAMRPGEAAVPVYVMAQSYPSRESDADKRLDHGAAGTVAMLADHWREVRYNESLIGYGADDGVLRRDLRKARIRERRDKVIYHIAHDSAAEQKNVPGKGRGDCYGRDDGFNFDNFEANRKASAV